MVGDARRSSGQLQNVENLYRDVLVFRIGFIYCLA